MDRRRQISSAATLLLCAGGLGAAWLLAGRGSDPAPPELAAGRAAAEPNDSGGRAPADAPATAQPVRARAPAPAAAGGEGAPPAPGAPRPTAREFGARSEAQHYERFLSTDLARLEAESEAILRGDADPAEQVALLRALHSRGSARSAELHLLALRELSAESTPRGESVPSTALLLLDRRAARDAGARELLRRAAFEPPLPAPALRRRAAASFFLRATDGELRGARQELARATDSLFLECALEALSRNPNTDAAAVLLAAHGRTPAGPVERVEGPR